MNRVILLIDDDPASHETLDALLASEPYTLVHAPSAIDGIRILASHAVDLVVSDVMMPGIDGFGLCGMIRANPAWNAIPIVLVTALDGREEMVRGLEVGADEFLSKPLDKVVLRARMRALLRLRDRFASARGSASSPEALLATRRQQLADAAALTVRERELLDLLLLGRSHADAALVMGVSVRTVKFHQANVLGKLGADSRNDLARLFLAP